MGLPLPPQRQEEGVEGVVAFVEQVRMFGHQVLRIGLDSGLLGHAHEDAHGALLNNLK